MKSCCSRTKFGVASKRSIDCGQAMVVACGVWAIGVTTSLSELIDKSGRVSETYSGVSIISRLQLCKTPHGFTMVHVEFPKRSMASSNV